MPPSFRGLLIHEAWPLSLSHYLSLSLIPANRPRRCQFYRRRANILLGRAFGGIRHPSTCITMIYRNTGRLLGTGVGGIQLLFARHYVGVRRNDINIGLIYVYRDVKESKYPPCLVLYIFPRECNRYYFRTLNEACLESFQRFK